MQTGQHTCIFTFEGLALGNSLVTNGSMLDVDG